MATGITQTELVTYNKNDLMHQVINWRTNWLPKPKMKHDSTKKSQEYTFPHTRYECLKIDRHILMTSFCIFCNLNLPSDATLSNLFFKALLANTFMFQPELEPSKPASP